MNTIPIPVVNTAEIIPVLLDYFSVVMLAIVLLVAAVNIIVEVVKKIVPKLPTDLLVFIVSIVVTVLALYIWAAVAGFPVLWYYVAAALFLAVAVAYAAMFGFDKFKALYDRLTAIKGT